MQRFAVNDRQHTRSESDILSSENVVRLIPIKLNDERTNMLLDILLGSMETSACSVCSDVTEYNEILKKKSYLLSHLYFREMLFIIQGKIKKKASAKLSTMTTHIQEKKSGCMITKLYEISLSWHLNYTTTIMLLYKNLM